MHVKVLFFSEYFHYYGGQQELFFQTGFYEWQREEVGATDNREI